MNIEIKNTKQISEKYKDGYVLTSEIKKVIVILQDGTLLLSGSTSLKHNDKMKTVDFSAELRKD